MPAVNLRDIYEIAERLENKLDSRLREVEKRTDKLENFNSRMVGAWLGITAIISVTSSWIFQKVFRL